MSFLLPYRDGVTVAAEEKSNIMEYEVPWERTHVAVSFLDTDKNLELCITSKDGKTKVGVKRNITDDLVTELATGKTEDIKLPKSDVLSYVLEGGAGAIVRPSGTEPKIKIYISSIGSNLDEAIDTAKTIGDDVQKSLNL